MSYFANYAEYWDKFYSNLKTKALWDVEVERGIERDYALLKKHCHPGLGIVDFGCGTGTQSFYLHDKFKTVVGMDVSSRAIAEAKKSNIYDNIVFYDVSAVSPEELLKMPHFEEDYNVYIRGVLHQIRAEDIEWTIEFLQSMIGVSGTIFIHEVSDKIRAYFDDGNDQFSKLPRAMQQTFISNLPPKGLNSGLINELFPDDNFTLEYMEDSFLSTRLRFKDGSPIQIPSIVAVIRQKN
jgi:SAM-dependent methyltransferase